MKDFVLEVCIDSVESAKAAVCGGATRLELCANLVIGGTTPSIFLYKEIRKFSDIPINAIIRPRFGDFCNTESELKIMTNEIKQFKSEGVDGIVSGVLNPDGTINMFAMETLREASTGIHFTMHRAFDMCKDPFESIRQAEQVGVDTVLTSGQENTCIDGVKLISEIVKITNINIMPGSGLTAELIPTIREKTGVSSFHLSGIVVAESPMIYRKENLSMGLPSLSEFELWYTSEKKISDARRVLESIE